MMCPAYRSRRALVRHQGKKKLVVPRTAWDLSSEEFWNGVVGDFSARLHEESAALHELQQPGFTPGERVEL